MLLPELVELGARIVLPPLAFESCTSTPDISWVPERFRYQVEPSDVERKITSSRLRFPVTAVTESEENSINLPFMVETKA